VKEWGSIISDLEEFNKLKVPRGCILADYYPCLRGFCDASERAYAAVLLGTLMLSRLVQSVATSLSTLSSAYLWTDSMVALHWVRNRKTWKPYVQSRVKEIRELTDSNCWNFCPGALNPADLPSRG